MTRRSSTLPILAALALVAVPLLLYLGGYFWLSERSDWQYLHGGSLSLMTPVRGRGNLTRRDFRQEWIASLYMPAAWAEAKCSGAEIEMTWGDGDGWSVAP